MPRVSRRGIGKNCDGSPSLEDAIDRAGMAVSPAGKRLNHQRRIPRAVLRAWSDALLERRVELRRCKTFDALHTLMAEIGADPHGIGDLAIYDTATRIGAFLKLEPDLVYLHAGVRKARNCQMLWIAT
jgi:hypothetical protein